ncbi:MAG: hypothetical protein ABL998_06780, partial [Planctomycetota bacterium]
MLHAGFFARCMLLSMLGTALEPRGGALEPGNFFQERVSSVAPGDEPCRSFLLAGFVLEPDGDPAEGARVTSSTGERAVTDPAGNFVLEVRVPRHAASVEVSVAGRAGSALSARASVAPPLVSGVTLALGPLTLAPSAPCSSSWLSTFGALAGTHGRVVASTVFDDGGGPALYLGGLFTSAGGVAASRIVKWDGAVWSTLASGLDGTVSALAGFNGSLYAGGNFTSAGGVPASNLARWDGSSWSALGAGVNGAVAALAVFDGALHVGGSFTRAGNQPAAHIAKWNGAHWAPLRERVRPAPGHDDGTDGPVTALAVFDDGTGPALYLAGSFARAGRKSAANVARWSGAGWSALASGTNG